MTAVDRDRCLGWVVVPSNRLFYAAIATQHESGSRLFWTVFLQAALSGSIHSFLYHALREMGKFLGVNHAKTALFLLESRRLSATVTDRSARSLQMQSSRRFDEEVDIDANKRAWARLLAKVYEFDPMVCPKCGRDMKVIAIIEDPDELREDSPASGQDRAAHTGIRSRSPLLTRSPDRPFGTRVSVSQRERIHITGDRSAGIAETVISPAFSVESLPGQPFRRRVPR